MYRLNLKDEWRLMSSIPCLPCDHLIGHLLPDDLLDSWLEPSNSQDCETNEVNTLAASRASDPNGSLACGWPN